MTPNWIPDPEANTKAQESLVGHLNAQSPFPMFWVDHGNRLAWYNHAAEPIIDTYPNLASCLLAFSDPEGAPLFPDPFPLKSRLNRSATWGPADAPLSWRGKLVVTPFDGHGSLIAFQRRDDDGEVFAAFEEEIEEQARNIFLTLLSHEAQTPINVILGFSQILSDRLPKGENRDIADSIYRAGENLLELLSDFMTAANVDSGLNQVKIVSFDIQKLLDQEILPFFRTRAAEKKLTFATMDNPDTPQFVFSDPRHVRHILFNILSNAIRFTEEGGVYLSLKVVSHKPHNSRMLSIAIMDTGPGIPEDLQMKIFRPFFRFSLDNTLHEDAGGIGLTIAQRLAQLIGGFIRLESNPGAGSTFFLEIPLEESTDNSEPLSQSNFRTSAGAQNRKLEGLSVLMVEDNQTNQTILRQQLAEFGIDPIPVTTVQAAIDQLQEQAFDLIFLDIELPDRSGADLVHIIRQAAPTSGQPFLVSISGHRNKSGSEPRKLVGIDAYMPKPFRQIDLKKVLQQALGTDL